ncbi:unnamed protein product [Effrenium voratum]|nr:unnamed protein product [Effrenium voratum]
MTGTNDSLKIRYQQDADTVNFQCEGSDDRIADFDLKLMQIESEHMEIPEQHYKVVAHLPSAEFQKICRDLKEFGETIQISASKEHQEESLKFMVQGDLGSGNVVLKPRQGDKPEERSPETVSLTVHEPVSATFALRYLVNFAKAEKLCGSVELGLGPDAPLLVKYSLESADKGHMQPLGPSHGAPFVSFVAPQNGIRVLWVS